jgi:hypothetical protein
LLEHLKLAGKALSETEASNFSASFWLRVKPSIKPTRLHLLAAAPVSFELLYAARWVCGEGVEEKSQPADDPTS